EPYALHEVGVERRSDGTACAVVAQLQAGSQRHEARGVGNGPVDAFAAAAATVMGPGEIVDYSEHAAAPGASALAIAYVAVRAFGVERYGVGRHEDVAIAALHAVVAACNRAARARDTARAGGKREEGSARRGARSGLALAIAQAVRDLGEAAIQQRARPR